MYSIDDILQEVSVKRETSCQRVILAEGQLDRHGLAPLLHPNFFDVIETDNLVAEEVLSDFSPSDIQLVLIQVQARSGYHLIQYLRKKVQAIRSIMPGIGVLFILEHPIVAPDLLPARVWQFNAQCTARQLLRYAVQSEEAKLDFMPNYRPFSIDNRRKEIPGPKFTLEQPTPNFNLKHPAMIHPIVAAAAKLGTAVSFEISPQEALTYFSSSAKSANKKVIDAFRQLRSVIDDVKQTVDIDVHLHLDHCDDPELIRASLDAGFDSIMADGSHLPLESNIQFVNKSKALAASYGVPVEGEVGAIDLEGVRHKSVSILEEVVRFVEATEVDYLGINVRQHHSCDYGYNRARSAYRQITDIRERDLHSRWNLLESCVELDQELVGRHFREDSKIRSFIHGLTDQILSDGMDGFFQQLKNQQPHLPMAFQTWSDQLLANWQQKQVAISEKLNQLHLKVIGKGISLSEKKEENKALDLDLLSQISYYLKDKPTRLVLHGGSSIQYGDLKTFKQLDVARINFGSRPFYLFLQAIRAGSMDPYNYLDAQIQLSPEVVHEYLRTHTRGWENWMTEMPVHLAAYQAEILKRYFHPFNTIL